MLALRADRVHTGEEPASPALVVVEDGRVVDVAPDPGLGAPGTVDLGDVTVLPGLVDAHLHLLFDASDDVLTPLREDPDEVLLARGAAHARAALAAGVTTARDLGDRRFLSLELRARTRDDVTAGPELLVAGPPLTRTRGHCWFLGGEADDADELRAAVRERAERGCDLVKVMVTGGMLTPGYAPHESQYDLERIAAVVDEAHACGLPVAAHAHGPDGVRDAVLAGVDSVEHSSWFTEDGVEVDWAVAEQMAARGTVVSATLGMLPGHTAPPAVARRMTAYHATIARLLDLGVRVVCGTDAGIAPAKPHDVLPHAVVGLVRRGLPFAAALAMATSAAAQACGLGSRKGRIAAGFDADLLVVRGSPEQDVNALLDVEQVYRAGVRVR